MKKTIAFLTAAIISVCSLSALPELSKYLENDLELKKLALEVHKAELSGNKTAIENGFDITLSTGNAKFKFDGDNTDIEFTPQIKISEPALADVSLSASSDIKILNGESTTLNTSIGISFDIVSSSSLNTEISLLKADRKILEAKRSLQNRALQAEKEYYTEIKNLYSSAGSIISAQKDMYEDEVAFDSIKAKGYAESSSKYRQAQMKVLSDKRNVDTKIHKLEHDCAVFAAKCGEEFTPGTNPEDFLSGTIPQPQAVDILSFNKEDYTKIENANYSHKLAELERKADRDFSLTATAGYTIKNNDANLSGNTESDPDTIDAGISAAYRGLTFGAGVNFPTDSSSSVYTLSASINPNKFRTASLTKKTGLCNEEEELLTIKAAEDDYNTDIVDKQTELSDIIWNKKTNEETYGLYADLEKDNAALLEQGVIKETEYLDAFANKRLYRCKIIINEIELIIYNNETKLLFCRDAEIQE